MLSNLTKVLIYFTTALFAVLLISGVIIKLKKTDKMPSFLRFALTFIAGYSVSTGVLLFSLSIMEMQSENTFLPNLFYPLLGLMLGVIVLIAVGYFIDKYKKQWLKPYIGISLILVVCYVLCLVFVDALKSYVYESFSISDNAILAVITVLFAAVLIVIPLIFGKKSKEENNTLSLVYAALCIALSFALSYLRIFKLPQGGSITYASLLPLALYSYIFGIRKGAVAGFIYGVLQAIQDPYILHPLQFILEYPIAFGLIGLAGIARDLKLFKDNSVIQFVTGTVFVAILRYFCHVVAGIIVFDIYAPEQFSAVAWSFLYNAFVFLDIAIVVIVGGVMLSSKGFRNYINSKNL